MSTTKLNPRKIYEKEKASIDKKLIGLLQNKTPESLYEPCEYILKGKGKRIRAFLVLTSTKAAGGNFKDARNAATAVEILHNFTLVHDDIMDNADKRRGLPTLHVKYDLSTAILSGDILIAIAYQLLLKDSRENDKSLLDTFTQAIIEVCEGQGLDKEFETKKNVSLDEYLLMIRKKTAALAEMCCSIGAQVGGADKVTHAALKNYGLNLGIAFQLQDDLLDIIGDESEFGKTVGGDLMEGKKTFLFIKALELAKGNDKKLLEKMIRQNGIRKSEIGTYKNLYERLGVIDITSKEVDKYTKRALNSVRKIKDVQSSQLLIWLANSLLSRTK